MIKSAATMTAPAVSVLMLLYNRPQFMRQAIESVLAQTFDDFEFVIIDHGSATPQPHAIAEEYAAKDKRIIVHRADKNAGVSAGRNMLLAKARGEFVATIEDDDWWAEDKLQKQIEFMREHKELGAVYCSQYSADENGKVINCSILDGKTYQTDNSSEMIMNIDKLFGSGVFFRRAALNAIGGWRSWFIQADDIDLFCRLVEKFPVHFHKSPLIYYRVHSGNLGGDDKIGVAYYYAAAFSAYCRQNGRRDIIDDSPPVEAVMEQAAAGFLPAHAAKRVAKIMLRNKKYPELRRFLAAYKTGGGKKRGKLLVKLLYWSVVFNRLGFWLR